MELKLLNFGHADPVEVRIIKITADSTFVNLNDEFQPMDTAGVEHGIILGVTAKISCDGAYSFASLITLDSDEPTSFTVEVNDDQPQTYDNLEQLLTGLESAGLRLIELEVWNPVPLPT